MAKRKSSRLALRWEKCVDPSTGKELPKEKCLYGKHAEPEIGHWIPSMFRGGTKQLFDSGEMEYNDESCAKAGIRAKMYGIPEKTLNGRFAFIRGRWSNENPALAEAAERCRQVAILSGYQPNDVPRSDRFPNANVNPAEVKAIARSVKPAVMRERQRGKK